MPQPQGAGFQHQLEIASASLTGADSDTGSHVARASPSAPASGRPRAPSIDRGRTHSKLRALSVMENDSGAAAQALGARLRDLEQRGGARTTALRTAEAPPARRHGLLFRLASHQLLTPVECLLGVWPLPRSLTTVPGTARWVLGVASHAGELLPIYDLRGLLLADYEGIQRRGLALVVPGASQPFGVVVDAVIGLRRTVLRARAAAQAITDLPLADLITATCDCAEGEVPVLDLAGVEHLPAFMSGALGVSAVSQLPTPAAPRAPRGVPRGAPRGTVRRA